RHEDRAPRRTRDQELEAADLVPSVRIGGAVLAFDPERREPGGGGEGPRNLEWRRPAPQVTGTERRTYLSCDERLIQRHSFHRNQRCTLPRTTSATPRG